MIHISFTHLPLQNITMFNYHNEAKVDNYPKVNDAVVKTAEVQQKQTQPSFEDDVMSGHRHRKTPTNMDNNYHPNIKANVDYDAKVNTLDRTGTATAATATSITVAAPSTSTSISLDEETNGRGFFVNDHDVLCGRGKGKPHSHAGSVNYRRLVSANKVSTQSPFHVHKRLIGFDLDLLAAMKLIHQHTSFTILITHFCYFSPLSLYSIGVLHFMPRER